jgi:hypothetical protein
MGYNTVVGRPGVHNAGVRNTGGLLSEATLEKLDTLGKLESPMRRQLLGLPEQGA